MNEGSQPVGDPPSWVPSSPDLTYDGLVRVPLVVTCSSKLDLVSVAKGPDSSVGILGLMNGVR